MTYTLPLPADGAVIGFDIRVGEKRIVGEVESHDKALRKYREALETGRVAGILEQDRADTFTQNLGNVPPKTAVEVEIRVLHPMAFHGVSGDNPAAEWEYRFPTVVGVRYEGEPGRVPDRDRLDVDRADGGTPVRLTLDLAIGDGDARGSGAAFGEPCDPRRGRRRRRHIPRAFRRALAPRSRCHDPVAGGDG